MSANARIPLFEVRAKRFTEVPQAPPHNRLAARKLIHPPRESNGVGHFPPGGNPSESSLGAEAGYTPPRAVAQRARALCPI